MTYTYQTVLAGDRNRAKIALYEMINKAKKLKQIDKDAVANKTNYAIEKGYISGAAFDVVTKEPIPDDHPFFKIIKRYFHSFKTYYYNLNLYYNFYNLL